MSQKEVRWAVALYDFQGNKKDRTISIAAGDIFRVSAKKNKDWWAADLKGKHGFVPRTYVKLFDEGYDPTTDPAAAASSKKSSSTTTTGTVASAASEIAKGIVSRKHRKESTSKSPTKQRKHSSKYVLALALHTFEKTQKGQLGFKKGQRLQVHPKKSSDWWPAVLNNEKGLVPRNYVRVLGNESSKASPRSGDLSGAENTTSANTKKDSSEHTTSKQSSTSKHSSASTSRKSSSKGSHKPAAGKRLQAVSQYDFSGSSSRELSFRQGDFLEVEPKDGADWWPARSNTGQTGLIPSNYVKVLGPASAAGPRMTKSRAAEANAKPPTRWEVLTGNVGIERASFMYGVNHLEQLPFFRVLFNDKVRKKHRISNSTFATFQKYLCFKTLRDGQIVVSEGIYNYNMYIIVNGSLSVLNQTCDLCTMRAGEWFGETSLFKTTAFPVTVTSSGHSTLLMLSMDGFKALVRDLPWVADVFQDLASARSASFLKTVALFSGFSTDKLNILSTLLCFRYVPSRQRVYKEGDRSKSFHIVKSGQVSVTVSCSDGSSSMQIKKVGKRGFFGEMALEQKPQPRTETATATSNTLILSVDGNKFSRFLALDQTVEEQFTSLLGSRSGRSLSGVPMLHAVPESKLDFLASMFDFQMFDFGDVVFRSGEVGDKFFLVARGEMESLNDQGQVLRTIGVGDFFGELALVEERPRDETISCSVGPCICLSLEIESFRTFLTAYPEVREMLLDSVINRGRTARTRRKFVNTQPDELAGVQNLPADCFTTEEASNAMKTWRNVGIAMAPCLKILQGWPEYMHPPEYEVPKRKKKFVVTMVGISEDMTTTKLHVSLQSTVADVVEQTFRFVKQRLNKTLDSGGPGVFGIKVTAKSEYLVHRDVQLGYYKYITKCLRRGMDQGAIEFSLVDLRLDPKVSSTGLRSLEPVQRNGGGLKQAGNNAKDTGRGRNPSEDDDVSQVYGIRMHAILMHDYSHGDLLVSKGEKIQVEPQQDDWWPATFNGKVGLVPKHYVNVVGRVHNSDDLEPLQNRFSLTRQVSDASLKAQQHKAGQDKAHGVELPGEPILSPKDWANTVRKCTAAAMEVQDSFCQISESGKDGCVSTEELLWPYRIQVRGMQKLASLPRFAKFEFVSIHIELVCGGTVLESKVTRPMKRKSTVRLDDEWYYFNCLVGKLHSSTRLCFTVIGEKTRPSGMQPSGMEQGGASSIMHAAERLDKVDEEKILAGGAFQLFDSAFRLKTGLQKLRIWPNAIGERSNYCENNPASNAAELLVHLDDYPHSVFFPIANQAPVKLNHRPRRHSALSASFRSRDVSLPRPTPLKSNAPIPTLSPKVKALLTQDPIMTYRMSDSEKSYLWQERMGMTTRADALPKLLYAVNWMDSKMREEGLKLLKQWVPPGPMQAMELLDRRHCEYRVREYAVGCLEAFDDDELAEFLLQLVQVLKYEPYHESPLARFLLRRALQNPREIGMRFFWALRAEMHKPEFAVRFGLLLQVYLQSCGRHRDELTQQYDIQVMLQSVANKVVTRKFNNKQERVQFCREELRKVTDKLPRSFSLSLDPRMCVKGLRVEKCKVMNSKKKPLWLAMESVDPKDAGGKDLLIMFKSGDDLRQDQMTLQMLRVMEQIWLEEGLDLRLTPYQCISTGDELGMIEVVTSAETTANIQKEFGGRMGALNDKTIRLWMEHNNKANFAHAVDNFVHSCAGYCVATYVMGIGDRHSDNIMIRETGHLFHIDFGHFLGNFKSKYGLKRERTPFVFTKEMAYVMGGKGEKPFNAFVDLCCKAYNLLRKHGNELINLFRLMIPAGMPELTSDEDIDYLCKKLLLAKSDEEAAANFKREINACLNDTYRRVDNLLHNWKTT